MTEFKKDTCWICRRKSEEVNKLLEEAEFGYVAEAFNEININWDDIFLNQYVCPVCCWMIYQIMSQRVESYSDLVKDFGIKQTKGG